MPQVQGPRERLLDAALRTLAAEGRQALQARKLTAEIGMSTMAVYTHFGGMPQLLTEVVRAGFTEFGRRLAEVLRSDDPVADLICLGMAYRDFALENANLYRFMFGSAEGSELQIEKHDLTVEDQPSDLPEAQATFSELVKGVERVMESGRFRPEDPVRLAAQFWSMAHGYCLLELAGFFGKEGAGVVQVFGPLGWKLLVGAGNDPEAATRSLELAISRRG